MPDERHIHWVVHIGLKDQYPSRSWLAAHEDGIHRAVLGKWEQRSEKRAPLNLDREGHTDHRLHFEQKARV